MQAVLHLAVVGHARPRDFRQAVDVVGLDIQQPLNFPAHVVRPRLGPKETSPQFERFGVDPHVPDGLADKHGVGRGAAQDIQSEILQQLHLPFGVAGRHRQGGSPHMLRPVMQAQTAGEQAVAIGHMNDVVAGAARSR